jgi:GH25 family lysozyme M1 (1,4-beta-N-acetylmuramidase)
MAVTFGLDISHHQDKNLSLAAARRDGCEFVVIKAGEGNSFVDPDFASNLAEARAAGMIALAYWYQRSSANAAQHVTKIAQVVPRDVPIIPDVEANSGGVGLTRDLVAQLRSAGYRVPLLYLPLWYWRDHLGSPSLAGLPPLWSSRYPDNVVGLLAAEWAAVPASYWNGYGGLDVALLQFTSSARIAGYQPLDASAFRGSRDQLAAFLGGSAPQEVDMDQNQDQLLREIHVELTGSAAPIYPGAGYANLRAAVKGLTDSVGALTAMVNKQSGNSAEAVAAALLPALAPIVKEALADVAGNDPGNDPAVFAQAVSDRLGTLLKGGAQ